mmetsp:Transcript_126242/g.365441  ORF Transcript_126242/g.365441 Transcript_126242/m.365441 type:complete len:204 (-) Transcript_126242:1115-1726(-)
MVSKLFFFSSARCFVISSNASLSFGMLSFISSIVSASSSFLASRTFNSAINLVASSKRLSRSFSALPTSVSQKPFFVASWVDSSNKRWINCWMRFFTLAKGSAVTFAAKEINISLLSRTPSSRRTAAACRPRVPSADSTCWPTRPPRSARPWRNPADANCCKNAEARAARAVTTCASFFDGAAAFAVARALRVTVVALDAACR